MTSAFTNPGTPSVSNKFLTATIICENEKSFKEISEPNNIDILFEITVWVPDIKKDSLPYIQLNGLIKTKKP